LAGAERYEHNIVEVLPTVAALGGQHAYYFEIRIRDSDAPPDWIRVDEQPRGHRLSEDRYRCGNRFVAHGKERTAAESPISNLLNLRQRRRHIRLGGASSARHLLPARNRRTDGDDVRNPSQERDVTCSQGVARGGDATAHGLRGW
jgi:hypothetical protein